MHKSFKFTAEIGERIVDHVTGRWALIYFAAVIVVGMCIFND
jgi:hypothetical protein